MVRNHNSEDIIEFTQERNPTNVIIVGKLSARNQTSECITELTLGRNPINAMIVPKPSVTAQPLFVIREHTLERNHTSVRTVEKLSARAHLLQSIRKLTLEKSPISVRNVEKLSARVHPFLNIRKLMLEGKPKNTEKPLVSIQHLASKREFILDKGYVNMVHSEHIYLIITKRVRATKEFQNVLQKKILVEKSLLIQDIAYLECEGGVLHFFSAAEDFELPWGKRKIISSTLKHMKASKSL